MNQEHKHCICLNNLPLLKYSYIQFFPSLFIAFANQFNMEKIPDCMVVQSID